MIAQLTSDASAIAEVWRFRPHPEVWILIVGLATAYAYMVRVIGPEAVPEGPVVTRRQFGCFIAALSMFWVASDWPLHDISENYLYSAHMLQHMMMSYFLAPLVLLSVPEWMARALLGDGRVYRGARFVCRPIVAAVIFNSVVMVTHVPGVVNSSVQSAPLHYGLHTLVVLTSILVFMPVCGPIAEFQLAPAPKMIYLFLVSVVPTIPAAWLTFAEGTVYKNYDVPVRVFGLSVQQDQQLAGAIMKLGGSIFLWTIILVIFIKHFVRGQGREMRMRDVNDAVPVGFVTAAEARTLTFEDVQTAFERTPAPAEPSTPVEP